MSTTPDLTRRSVLRRAAAAGLLATPAAGLLAACAGGTDNKTTDGGGKSADNPFGVKDGSTVNVVVFNGGLGDEYPKFDKTLFNAKHAKVTVNLSSTQKIKTEQQPKFATTPADLINNSGADSMANDALIKDGALADLEDLLAAGSWEDEKVKVKETLLPGTVADGTQQGKFYILNYAFTVFGVWYNQALFDKNGWTVPKSFDEFWTLSEKIKTAGLAPFTFAGFYPYYGRWAINAWIWLAGGEQAMIDIDNLKEGAWKTPEVTAALTAVEKLASKTGGYTLKGSETLTHTQSQQAFLDGKAAFLPVGTWLENEMKATIPADFKLKIAPFWAVSAADKAPYGSVQAGAGEGWIVPAKAPNKEGGKEFLRAMLSKEGAGKFASLTASLASRAGSGDAVTGKPSLESANAVMKAAPGKLISWKYDGWYASYDKASQAGIGEFLAGRITAAQFADRMEAAAKAVVKEIADGKAVKQTRTAA